MSELKREHFIRVPVSDFSTPRNGMFTVYVDYWWEVTKDGCLLFYRGGYKRNDLYTSPQCNQNEQIARRLSKRFNGIPFEVDVMQFPVIFVPLILRDYV